MAKRELAKNAKVLMVGTGGIGCELLKCLASTGFKHIDIVDMDTIEVSNLNRQFLFRREHVGKSKVEVAKETMKRHFPDTDINTHFANIINEEFNAQWFGQFTLIMNALDNVAARSHVNRMCLAAGVPLIDAGTAGFQGQVEVIIKGLTKCYECDPKLTPKTYPTCTIRNTPSEPIHCIVWGKHLFAQLFGEDDDETSVSPDTAVPELAGSSGEAALVNDSSDTVGVERVSTKKWSREINYNPVKLFDKFFYEDIQYLLCLKDLWKSRRAPVPLKWQDAISDNTIIETDNEIFIQDQKVWSIAQCAEKFREACENLKNKLYKLEEFDNKAILIWDKDDNSAMDFVTACANIRSHIFGIEKKSRYDIKSMAGNIIPAIATANATVAGLVIFQAMHILKKTPEKCRTVYLRHQMNHRGVFISTEKNIIPPNPKCLICSAASPEVTLSVDVNKMTIKQLRDLIFKKHFKMVEPEVTIPGSNFIIISCDDDMNEEYYNKKLSDLNIKEGSILRAEDFFQTCKFFVCIKKLQKKVTSEAGEEEDDDPLFEIVVSENITSESTNGDGIPENGQTSDDAISAEVCDVDELPSCSNNGDGGVQDDDSDDVEFVREGTCRMGVFVINSSGQPSSPPANKRPLDGTTSSNAKAVKKRKLS